LLADERASKQKPQFTLKKQQSELGRQDVDGGAQRVQPKPFTFYSRVIHISQPTLRWTKESIKNG
jgi:hypothetical protein